MIEFYTYADPHIVKCFSSDVNTKKEVGFTAFVTALDIISDIMGMTFLLSMII